MTRKREGDGFLRGASGAPGIGVAAVWTLPPHDYAANVGNVPHFSVEEALAALSTARSQIKQFANNAAAAGRVEEAEIFGAQELIAGDPTLANAVRSAAANGADGAAALQEAGEAQASVLVATGDEYFAARATDVRDVVGRAMRVLLGGGVDLPAEPSILVADDLPPSISAEIPRELLRGIALRSGSPTAHAVILARAAGIPCVVAISGLKIDGSLDGRIALLDGEEGTLRLDPDATALSEARVAAEELGMRSLRQAARRGERVKLGDGSLVRLFANVGSSSDVARAIEVGAEGIGLLRSEFLLLNRAAPPSEDEQVRAFIPMFEVLGSERPLTLRLADIGGDKRIPYLRLAHEDNPFLGVRGYRLATLSDRADLRNLFASQLRAALLAAAASSGNLRVMAPMISIRAEVDDLLKLVAEVRAELARRGERGDPAASAAARYPLKLGVMIETPAAALTVADLADGLDFVSIGTNDLTQYAMAADRGNPALAKLQDATAPAVVALIRAAVDGATRSRLEVGVCGELAGSSAGAKLLVGLGIRELSVDPAHMDGVREALIGV